MRRASPKTKIVYIGEKGGKYHDLTDSNLFDERYFVSSGKFRRYHGESWFRRLFDIKTNAQNTRDLIKITIGILQGAKLLKKLSADVVFLKGGSVCIPIGLGASRAGVSVVTHDSDALPGLSNRIGGRNAVIHTTAMPEKYYNYPKSKTIQVGLPINDSFRKYSADEVRFLKEKWQIPPESQVLLITGGSGGALRLNAWCQMMILSLLQKRSDLYVFFVTGKGKNIEFGDNSDKIKAIEFTHEMHHLSAMADVVISRAGATTLAEFAAQSKAVVVVPNPDLTGGHQLKNSVVYADAGALVLVNESELSDNDVAALENVVSELLDDQQKRHDLGYNLHQTLPKISASEKIAEILIDVAKKESQSV